MSITIGTIAVFLIVVVFAWRRLQRVRIAPDQARYVVGIDIGMKEGSTAIVVMDSDSGQVINEHRPTGSYDSIKQFVHAIVATYDPQYIAADVGPHYVIIEDWKREGINVKPIQMTRKSKLLLHDRLRHMIDSGRISIPPGVAEDDDGEAALMIANDYEPHQVRPMTVSPSRYD